MKNKNPWIEVWPFQHEYLKITGSHRLINMLDELHPRITNTKTRAKLSDELSSHTEKLWAPKAEKGWKSSWVPYLQNIVFKIDVKTSECGMGKDVTYIDKMNLGTMAYKEIEAINDSIEKNLPFKPKSRYNPCLSVGFLTATSDGKVIFQRRPENVHCPNILIHEPCGYMTSLAYAPRAECDKPEHAFDSRLFDLKTQLDYRAKEIADTFSVPVEEVSYDINQDLLACGWKSIEMYFSTTGKINARQRDLKIPQNQEVFFVPFEHLKQLIYNQGKLCKINPNGYRPSDARDIPLIDESLIGLIYGYEKLTGDKLNIKETVDKLNKRGLEITVHDTSPSKSYDFSL